MELWNIKLCAQSGTNERVNISGVDIRSYAKYVLQEGEGMHKRELLSCLKGKIYLASKEISIKE